MNKILLNGTDWKLVYVKNERLVSDGETFDTDELKSRGYTEIPATVPGNLEIDLERSGKKEDVFYGKNFRDRACEYLHAYYYRDFDYDGSLASPMLVFEAIDTVSDVYLNGIHIAHTEDMFISQEIEVSGALKIGSNRLTVHIRPAVIEARKYPITMNEIAQTFNKEALHIRKAAHMYGWDIMPRIVSAGIWRPVYLLERKPDRISEVYCCTRSVDTENNTASLYFMYNTELSADEIDRYALKVSGKCKDSVFSHDIELLHSNGYCGIHVDNARFWWPRNAGNPDLYDLTVTLLKDGKEVDTYTTRLGIRTVKLDRTSLAGENGKFMFIINGKPIFCLGTNWVPADALHSRDAERIPQIMPLIKDIGCNMIRIWGGGVYEDDYLYDYCDENGIMIWQDFMMGCGVYPLDSDFEQKMIKEVTSVVKRLRGHASLVLWAGDNEDDTACVYAWGGGIPRDPNEFIKVTRKTIPSVLRMHDYSRPYLPSSPYVDEAGYKNNALGISEDHLWGPRDYFKGDFYGKSVCHFASETGYHGCPSPKSLEKYVPQDKLWTSTDPSNWNGIDNDVWLAHATTVAEKDDPSDYRIRLMADQVTTLFGSSVPNTLSDFAKASQISQAEAKKFFIERFRVTKWYRTGIIWWNIMDGWPQISDAIVDYYFCKKAAYHYVKRSQEPVCLMFNEPSNGLLTLHAVNDLGVDKKITYKVTSFNSGNVLASGICVAKADASVPVCSVEAPETEKDFLFIEWECDGKKYSNHYVTNIKDLDYKTYLGYISKCGYDEFEGF